MKYCSYYSCGRLISEEHTGDKCPHCGHEKFSWEQDWIKPLPPEAYEVNMQCKRCGSTDELIYKEKHTFGNKNQFHYGNSYECQPCKDAFDQEILRQEAMHYIVINPDDDEMEFYQTKSDVEDMFENFLEDYWNEDGDNPFSDWVILKVEALEDLPTQKHFEKRNVLFYEDEWYIVEEIIEPEYEYNGDHTVNW